MRPFAVVSFVFSAQLVSALGSFPTCMSGFDWTFNHLNQSPCEVASALGEACTGSDFPIPALSPDQNYLGPVPASANNCRCSSVFYSVLSACAVCQNAEVMNWSFYAQNCSTVSISVFIPPIPSGFAVPNYAYVDPTAKGIDVFNPKIASSATGPDSTAVPQATGTSGPSPSDSSTPTKKKSTNAGAIAGGVVGGVVAILIIVGLVIFLRRRKSKAQPTDFNSDRLMSENNSAVPNTPMLSGTTAPTKYYDPNDPTTFPDNYTASYSGQSPAAHSQTFPTGTMAATNYTGITNQSGFPHHNVHQQPGGQAGYTGMAEVM